MRSLVVEELLACRWATHIILSRDSLCMGLASEAGEAPRVFGGVCCGDLIPACVLCLLTRETRRQLGCAPTAGLALT